MELKKNLFKKRQTAENLSQTLQKGVGKWGSQPSDKKSQEATARIRKEMGIKYNEKLSPEKAQKFAEKYGQEFKKLGTSETKLRELKKGLRNPQPQPEKPSISIQSNLQNQPLRPSINQPQPTGRFGNLVRGIFGRNRTKTPDTISSSNKFNQMSQNRSNLSSNSNNPNISQKPPINKAA